MPEKPSFEPQDTLSGQDFSFRQNKEMSSAQANETFVVDARFNRSLGENGETMGFAKKQFSNDPELQTQREQAVEKLMKQESKLKKAPGVQQFIEDRSMLRKPAEAIALLDKRLETARLSLTKAQQAEQQDPAAIEAAQKEVTSLQRERASAQNVMDNPALERKRLAEVLKVNPQIAEYVKVAEKMKAALALMGSNQAITTSSGNLYADKSMMDDGDLGGDRQLLSRAVASHEVDKLIGLNVCAQEKFGQDDQGNVVGISVQCDGAGVRSQFGTNEWGETKTAFLDINYAEPEVQKGLYDLEALDYITGQFDRHRGNIFVDPDTGKVTGIDNDLAFPAVDRDDMIRSGEKLSEKAVLGMPLMMHEDTKAKILAIDPEALKNTLASVRPPDGSPGLGPDEIAGAVGRLKELQAELVKENSKIQVVPEFNDATYAQAITTQEASLQQEGDIKITSYIGAVHGEGEVNRQKVAEGDDLTQMRGADTVGKASLNLEYAAFKQQMKPSEQSNYLALQAQMAKLENKLAEVRKDMAKMENPGVKEKLAALKHGGVNGTRQHLFSKEAAIVKDLSSRMNGIKLMAVPHVEAMQLAQDTAKAERQAQRQAAADKKQFPFLAQQAPEPPKVLNQPAPPRQAALPKSAEDEQDVSDPDDLDAEIKVDAEVKQEGLAKKPSVAEMLKRTNSAPQLSGHKAAQGVGGEEPKPASNSLRASGGWQPAKTSAHKPGGSSLSASHN
jgi:hypothetical protein